MNETILDFDSRVQSLLLFGNFGVGLGAHDATAPMPLRLLVLVRVTLLDGGNKLGELAFVLGADFSDGENSGSLLVDDSSQASLAFDDGIWNTHLPTQGRKEDN